MDKKNRVTKPIAIDLFAGAGGFSLAAVQAGCTIAIAIENDAYAVKTYTTNILKYDAAKKAKVLDRSILEYVPESVRDEFLGSTVCDLLLGGPPCQGFSTHRILDAGVNDPRNQLVLAYFKFVKAFRPRVFLMENVPGILWERHKAFLEKFYEEGARAGYTIFSPVVLDARDFGVPQRRKRVFILGVRDPIDAESFVWPPKATHIAPGKAKAGQKQWISCADVFKAAPVNDENDIHMNHGSDLVNAFRNTPPNGGSRKDSGRVLPCHEKHDGHKDVYGRINPAEPAPTMTTACINPSKGRFVHPTEHHGITLRQAARIQTFPDTFTFIGGLTAAGRQIGNAVPVELGRYLIKYIKSNLLDRSLDQTGVDASSSVKEKEIEKV
ncbi:DNA cytosine methyltransferase [Leclercia adecarboxylata]|uniref:Cytosine-specific methyltransferase n=1 Tax=Leclercia adecarboxylata TaxID=83655 RepID=A0AAP9ISM5_9ENTR|nr:DNA cytosine methyltransferase [Leclercia adecarboxylata]QDK21042.1 DNA cytosine methyltransferase [Leclercia adecarboxylata]